MKWEVLEVKFGKNTSYPHCQRVDLLALDKIEIEFVK